MGDMWLRFADNMVQRITGPMHFRLLLQPIMASTFAIIAGWKDAKAGNPPYFWSLLSDRTHRRDMLKDGWKGVGKIFVLAIVLDIIYQIIVLHFIYPGETIIIAIVLAIIPYLLLRGTVTRLMRAWHRKIGVKANEQGRGPEDASRK